MLESAGFHVDRRQRFLLGATHLWACTWGGAGERAPAAPGALQAARRSGSERGGMPTRAARRAAEWRAWTGVQLIVAVGIFGLVGWAGWSFWRVAPDLPIQDWQRRGMGLVLIVGLTGFAFRSIVLLARLFGAPPRD